MSIPSGIPGLEEAASADGMPTVYVARERLVEAAAGLRAAGFGVMIDMIPVDLHPSDPRFEVSYLLLNPGGDGAAAARLRLKVRVPAADPVLPSVSSVWAAANWAERESYDLYGIHFTDHPDLRRILLPEDWEGHPMRKDYPVQINAPVKTYEPLQLTPEQFVANLAAARERAER